MEGLRELLVGEIKDLYSAEKQILNALPKIVRGCDSTALKSAITEHLDITRGQVTRLEQVFEHLDKKPKGKHCKGMEGLLEEGAEFLEEENKGSLRDLQLIGAAQRVEHYEVAAYGTAKTMAEHLGLSEAARLLAETLAEEKEADEKLTAVAQALYREGQTASDEDSEGEEDDLGRANNGRRAPSGRGTSKRR